MLDDGPLWWIVWPAEDFTAAPELPPAVDAVFADAS
jgi:hypothetical protein